MVKAGLRSRLFLSLCIFYYVLWGQSWWNKLSVLLRDGCCTVCDFWNLKISFKLYHYYNVSESVILREKQNDEFQKANNATAGEHFSRQYWRPEKRRLSIETLVLIKMSTTQNNVNGTLITIQWNCAAKTQYQDICCFIRETTSLLWIMLRNNYN